ncbi:putative 6-phosphogluconolactonase [Talaromyces pinophilus]|nr:putative 6-phosphogluconolactonase [Talaromyces pinophilus]
MHPLKAFILSSSLLTGSVLARGRTLYVSHYDGHIYTLKFDPKNPDPNTSLTLSNTLQACGSMPSWLELDTYTNTLYCVDESGTSQTSGNGSLTALDITAPKKPRVVSETETLAGGVASVIYDAGDDEKFIAIAHYEGSSLSTFPLPLTNDSSALQTFLFTLTGPVTDPSRQDAPHPHEVFLDPTNSFILSPDLGADLIRIFAINPSDGTLTECEAYKTTPGNGPRHGAFSNQGDTLYITNELANTVSTYTVSYNGNNTPCALSLDLQQEIVPSPSGTLPASFVAEIRIPRHSTDVYITVRGDQSFAPNDTIAFLDESSSATGLTPKNLTSSFGAYPRTLVISEDGCLVAVGNQKSSSVAIVERDAETGELGALLGSLEVGSVEAGLSSVIWGSD